MNQEIAIIIKTVGGGEANGVIQLTDENISKIISRTREYARTSEEANKKVVTSSYGLNMALMQTGYAMGDMQMIGTNFRMVLLGIGNNLPMIAQGFMMAAKDADSMGVSLSSLVAKSIMGPAGVLIGINLTVTAIQVLVNLFSKSTAEADKNKNKVQELGEKYEDLTKRLYEYNFANTDEAKKAIKEQGKLRLQMLDDKKIELEEKLDEIETEKRLISGKLNNQNLSVKQYNEYTKQLADLRLKRREILQNFHDDYNNFNKEQSKLVDKTSDIEQRALYFLGGKGSIADVMNYLRGLTRNEIKTFQGTIEKTGGELIPGSASDVRAQAIKKAIDEWLKPKEKDATPGFKTDAEIRKEIAALQNEFSKASEPERVRIMEEINKLKEQLRLWPWLTPRSLGTGDKNKFAGGAGPSAMFGSFGIDLFGLGKNNIKLADYEPKGEDYMQAAGVKALGRAWTSTGDIMASSISRSLGLLTQTNNMLTNILNNIINIALQMAITGLFGGLFSLLMPENLGGGSFLKGFGSALGLGKSVGGGINIGTGGVTALASLQSVNNAIVAGEISALRQDMRAGLMRASIDRIGTKEVVNQGSRMILKRRG